MTLLSAADKLTQTHRRFAGVGTRTALCPDWIKWTRKPEHLV